MGRKLSDTELQKSLDFCAHVFTPMTPEQELAAQAESMHISKELLEKTETKTPAVLEVAMKVQNGSAQHNDEPTEVKVVDDMASLPMTGARHLIKDEYELNNFETETLFGYSVRFTKGQLGLKAA